MGDDVDNDGPRLFGVPDAEHLEPDLVTAYETQIEPHRRADADEPWLIEEWSVRAPWEHVPAVDALLEWACEWVAQNEVVDQDGYFDLENAAQRPEIREAFEAALDLWASASTYRMADKLLFTYPVRWDEAGEPLIGGVSLYRDETP